ncbi:uncharacterized protein LOC124666133 [Lolium rigidum]|uniref:uncharacterized protein LOC124666133 n=1 Tax=Lolium rigidum TaxID=89674 RepID=UPI001F5E12A9|nr:uncharacterized protein LOC124666133 [Lolium rigidum]
MPSASCRHRSRRKEQSTEQLEQVQIELTPTGSTSSSKPIATGHRSLEANVDVPKTTSHSVTVQLDSLQGWKRGHNERPVMMRNDHMHWKEKKTCESSHQWRSTLWPRPVLRCIKCKKVRKRGDKGG